MRDVGLLLDGLLEACRLDLFDLLYGFLELRRITPNVGPVSVSNTRGKTGTNGIGRVLRGVDVIRVDSIIASEVLTNDGSILTDVAEVDLYELQELIRIQLRNPRKNG